MTVRRRPSRPDDPRLSAEHLAHGFGPPPARPHGADLLRVNWSGYPIPRGSTMTVAEATAYYVEGQPMEPGGQGPEDPGRQRELGMPISADDTARHHTQADPQRPVNGGGWKFHHLPDWCGIDRTPPRSSRAGDHQRQPETRDPDPDPVDVAVQQQQLEAYQTTIFDHLPGIS